MNMREPIISFKDYTYHYRAQAAPTITDINLEIYKGERIIIVGPSGCGKSTLAHCLNGLNPFSYPGESKGYLTSQPLCHKWSGVLYFLPDNKKDT